MHSIETALKRTCAAFVVRIARDINITGKLHNLPLPLTTTRLFSTFQPADPPGTRGTPVFPDIDFSVAVAETRSSGSNAIRRSTDPKAVFVVTGANRGIGLQFVKSLIDRTEGTIVACCRSPETANDLTAFASALNDPGRIYVEQLDVEDQTSIERLGTEIKDSFDRVDLLLNVAGILGDGKTTPGPERSLAKVNREWLEKTLAVNVIGPVMLAKELLPLMVQKPRGKKSDGDHGRPTAVIANLSARVGSISDNGLGGWYSYRMSKSALNQATRTMALELKRHSTWTVALHPGTTDTGLSKPFQGNVKEGSLFPVEFTVTQLLNVIDSMQEENSGGFYDWAGQAISF